MEVVQGHTNYPSLPVTCVYAGTHFYALVVTTGV